MLIRSLRRIPPSLLLLLVFLAFFGWQLSQGPNHDAPEAPRAEVGKKSPRIAVLTFITQQRSYVYLSVKNKDHYARRHGYDLFVDYESHTERAVVYWKFNMAEKVIKSGKYDWIWWLDFDTLITNTDIKVTDIIEEELRNATNPNDIDYIVTHDCNGFNGGSFLIRGHERSLKFMYDAWALDDDAKAKGENLNEQDALFKLMKEDEAGAHRVHKMPQWKLNAFPEEISCFDELRKPWEHGMFVLHFAGAWAHVKGEDPTGYLMKKYEGDIIWGDWKDFY
ncbi:glycosyltransferase family 34 protein [Cucurbitaria berberidis CBS 394.84]|uniref:Glycosyltransferase family 34 protein n=1 Tax=Cucurbitaria berberidis CBS 394.84 TaxID=1168544 RepID=A0A9P4G7Z7_9PLEO|nr:glycosyltransferase family 34 protein [Cucurbitaria berberidis CBS 394.84]KAF1840597.1 glycosyltransferase family 34 protein [Cucurbitaria berberidis CBS 394.84]